MTETLHKDRNVHEGRIMVQKRTNPIRISLLRIVYDGFSGILNRSGKNIYSFSKVFYSDNVLFGISFL